MNTTVTEEDLKIALKGWAKTIRPYTKANNKKAIWQICTSILPFIGLWILMYWTYKISYLLTLLIAVLNAFFLVRIFIIQHDCGHHSFFNSKTWNNIVGFICSLFSIIPFKYWAINHNFHHVHSGQLETRDIGDIQTLTVQEYVELSPGKRFKYRMFRHPLVMFTIGPLYYILFTTRLPMEQLAGWKKTLTWLTFSNLAIFAAYFSFAWWLGWKTFFAVQFPITLFFGVIAIWFFYVQHQHEHAYKQWKENWEFLVAALKGSSFYNLPKIWHWLTGNIGYHHIHHLSSGIPNYNLAKCAEDNPVFQKYVTKMSFVESLTCLKHKLWDEASQRMISFTEFSYMEKMGLV